MSEAPPTRLRRELGLAAATMLGLGSMVGTGVFVSIGIAAGATGPSILLAILAAALVATCNALSSAQLAASHAVSGGTYEYGYIYLTPALGFTAGWMFLCAKTASAATAALGFAGYLLGLLGVNSHGSSWLAVAAVAVFTVLVLSGIKRASWMNTVVVSITLIALATFIVAGLPGVVAQGGDKLVPLFPSAATGGVQGWLYATALMFVAYTGYARIATLGEEVTTPRRTIPRAIIVTLIATAVLYLLVATVVVGSVGAERFANVGEAHTTPLELVSRSLGLPVIAEIVAIGAVTAMLGVLLNLLLGLSRVVLAMGRQGDLPPLFARLTRDASAPRAAVVLVGLLTALLAAIGSIETSWAFSAFTVLIYYAITNFAALRLPAENRLYPRWIAVAGLAACLFLAFWVPVTIWLTGLGLIAAGLAWKVAMPRLWADSPPGEEGRTR